MSLYMQLRRYVVIPAIRLRFRCKVSGIENIPDGGVILAANHQRAIDPIIMAVCLPRQISFGAKEELFRSRLGRWFFTRVEQIPVARGGGRQAVEAFFARASHWLQNGYVLGLFPEGTRSDDGRLHRLHTGVARIALQSGAPIVPVGITYGGRDRFGRLKTTLAVGRTIDSDQRDRVTTADTRALNQQLTDQLRQLTGQEYEESYARH